MRNALRITRHLVHAAALVFGAFWLVATSAPTGPARTCFTGIGNPSKLAVVLGTPDATQTGAQSCNGVDGLVPGATIVFSLSQEPRPQDVGEGSCWAYRTDALEGTTDVTVNSTTDLASGGADLTSAWGSYSSSQSQGCRGGWRIELGPSLPPEGDPISPLAIQPSDGWHVSRSIDIEQAQFCDGAFPGSGPVGCADSFPIASITEVSP